MLLTPIILEFQDSSWREDKIFMSLGNKRDIHFAQIYYVSAKCITPTSTTEQSWPAWMVPRCTLHWWLSLGAGLPDVLAEHPLEGAK